jgi:hypothetical protein
MQLMLTRLVIVVFLFSLIFASCQWSEDRSLEREVTNEELVGVWVLQPQSVRDLESVGIVLSEERTSHRIALQANGSCRLRAFLTEDIDVPGPAPTVTSSRCRWELITGPSSRQHLSLELTDLPRRFTQYHLSETADGNLVLWQYIGDPDFWDYLDYARTGS